ncbi:GspH/FimT family pseudopilin [Ectothiorhodospiraceae bacterium WFHF3C12]|nr:GspH/FimT family pseudopilin [Ectothiorhodospiraceae bacterium WFHF3C12]
MQRTGFTLPELLVSLSVAATLTALVAPSFMSLVRDQQANTTANRLLVDLHMARSEAVTRGVDVFLCKGSASGGCATTGGWHQGWLAFSAPDGASNCVDADNDAHCDGHRGEILSVHTTVESGLSITGNGLLASRARFHPTGFSTGYAGTLSICSAASDVRDRGFVLSMSGRIRKAKSDDLNCP